MAAALNKESPAFHTVAFAASAGGIPALMEVLSQLPADFPAALVIVQHVNPRHRSALASILARRTALAVSEAHEGDKLRQGHVYTAPPNRHTVVKSDYTLSLTDTERVHFVRPSADVLFESVAASCRKRAIAVVLSGSGLDGADGVAAIKRMGGTVIVQDPSTAESGGMPQAAIKTGMADFALRLDEIAPTLLTLCASKAAT